MSNPRFVATIMIPITQSFEAESIPHAQAMLHEFMKTDLSKNCVEKGPKPFLHSMQVIPGDDTPIPEAA